VEGVHDQMPLAHLPTRCLPLWLSLCLPSSPLQTNVGRQLKEMLMIPDTVKMGFMAHSDAKRDDRRAKERYVV
jgi:hypothetical protein